MSSPVIVSLVHFHTTSDQVVEVSDFVVENTSGREMVRVYHDLTSDQYSFEGDNKYYMFDGDQYNTYQVVRIATPLAIGESRFVDDDYVAEQKSKWGNLGWAEMLTLQAPIGKIVPTIRRDAGIGVPVQDSVDYTDVRSIMGSMSKKLNTLV